MSAEVNPLTGMIVNISNQVINQFACVSKEGNNVGAMPLSLKVPLLRCIADGDGYKQNRGYILKADENGYDPLFPVHTHSPEDTVNDGGSNYEILKANSKYDLIFDNRSAIKEGYMNRILGTSTIANDLSISGSAHILLTSKYDASGYSATLLRGGLRLNFGFPFVMTIKQALSHSTDIVYRGGVNMAYTEALAGSQNQVGIDGCSSATANYRAASSSGSGATYLALTGSAMQQANAKGYKITYIPNDKVIFQDSLGNEVIKTTEMPAINTGSESDATLRIGVTTTNATDKLLKLWASLLIGRIYDITAGVAGWL